MKLQPLTFFRLTLLVSTTTSYDTYSQALESNSELYEEFQNPSNAARPHVWWHWINGNISQEGIRIDLEWMKQTGIGGFQNFGH